MRRQISYLTLISLLLFGGTLSAQESEIVEQPIVSYDIELIVFEYVGGINSSREDWAYIDKGRDAAVEAHARRQSAIAAATSAANDDEGSFDDVDELINELEIVRVGPVSFNRLPTDEYRLQEQFGKMRASRNYRPIAHTAWRQPVFGPAQATTLELSSLAQTPARLGGSVSIYVSRFLHLKLDLSLAEHLSAQAEDAGNLETTLYSLRESRKMRSGEIHFFDHPRFGAIALISRIELEEPDTQP